MLIFFALQSDGFPVWVKTLGGAILLLLAILNAWQFYKSKNSERLASALNASETERKIHDDSSKRKTVELEQAYKKIGELSSKTDLTEVLKMLGETISLSRETAAHIAASLDKHGIDDQALFQKIDGTLSLVGSAINDLRNEIKLDREEAETVSKGITSTLEAIERRLNRT